MDNYIKGADEEFEDEGIVTSKELESVSGGDIRWNIVEEGDALFECYGHWHSSIFHYFKENSEGPLRTHVSGICSVCGAYNDYTFL